MFGSNVCTVPGRKGVQGTPHTLREDTPEAAEVSMLSSNPAFKVQSPVELSNVRAVQSAEEVHSARHASLSATSDVADV